MATGGVNVIGMQMSWNCLPGAMPRVYKGINSVALATAVKGEELVSHGSLWFVSRHGDARTCEGAL
jgi:hypothetical protein